MILVRGVLVHHALERRYRWGLRTPSDSSPNLARCNAASWSQRYCHIFQNSYVKDIMEHEPSKYIGAVELTYKQMWEMRKAISFRIGEWIGNGQLSKKEQEIGTLMEVGILLDKHINHAVAEWEDAVVDREILELDKSIEKMLEEEDE